MPKREFKSSYDVIDFIKENPVKAYFELGFMESLKEEMDDNAEDLADGIATTCRALAVALLQLVELLFFPITKLIRFCKLRRDILRGKYHIE